MTSVMCPGWKSWLETLQQQHPRNAWDAWLGVVMDLSVPVSSWKGFWSPTSSLLLSLGVSHGFHAPLSLPKWNTMLLLAHLLGFCGIVVTFSSPKSCTGAAATPAPACADSSFLEWIISLNSSILLPSEGCFLYQSFQGALG